MAHIQITERDFVAAQMFAARRRRGVWLCEAILFIYMAIVGAMFAFSSVTDPSLRPAGYALLAWVALSILAVAAIFFILTPWIARQRYRHSKLLHTPKTLTWNHQALTTQSTYGTNAIPWCDCAGYMEDPTTFLIYTGPHQCICIPKHALTAAELTDLQNTLHQHLQRRP